MSSWNLLSQLLECTTLRTLFVSGPPGIGKTFGAYRYGLRFEDRERAVYAVTLTEDTPAAELRGHYIPHGGEFRWHDGPAIVAMRQGARLVLNEVSHAGPDVHSILHAILESPETARLTLPSGETVKPMPGFQCILTDNCEPEELPQALRDRIDACIGVSDPAPQALESFPEALRDIVLASSRAEPSRRISLRSWEALDRLMSGGLTLDESAMAVFGEARWKGIETSLRVALAKPVEVPPVPIPVPAETV